MTPHLADAILDVLALVFRTTVLICLVLLFRFFVNATGPIVRPFREVFFAWIFIAAWAWVSSVGEVLGYISSMRSMLELGAYWIFLPNLVVTVALARLLRHLYQQGHAHGHRRHKTP